jgi:hypothetical protein
MMNEPMTRYRPTRTPVGNPPHSYTETLGTGVTVWGIRREHDEEIRIVVDAGEDIQIGDILEIEEDA